MSFKEKENGFKWIVPISAIAIGYAIFRYHIIGDIPWKDLPVFVLNKGVSLSAVILLTLSVSIKPLSGLGIQIFNSRQGKKTLGISGLMLTVAHILLSFLILDPNYLSVFFEADGTLSYNGSLSLLAGVVSFILLLIYHQCFRNGGSGKDRLVGILTSRKFILPLLLLFGMHVLFMGYAGWMTPTNWQGGLPPITLISYVVVFLGVGINFFRD